MVACKSMLVVCGAAVLGLVIATAGNASVDARRITHLTFSAPVGLPGVTLPAGTYTFELAAPDMDLDIVRVSSRDRSRVYVTAFTRQVDRPAGRRPARIVTFAETRTGMAPRVSAWYPIGTSTGHEFVYADNSR